MKRLFFFVMAGLSVNSCEFFTYHQNKEVSFSIYNTGNSSYSKIIVYAKDSLKNIVDSTPSQGHSPPGWRGVTLGFTLSRFEETKKGVFEVQAKILNGKLLSQEFGLIDGLNTRQEFKIDLKDSTIIIK